MIEDAASGTVEERLRNRIGRNRPQCFQSLAQALVGTIGHGSGAVGTKLGNALGSAFTKIVGEEFSLMVSITTDRTWSGVKTGWTWTVRLFEPTKLGASQEEFADMCGLDRTYMDGIERGERNVALRNIEKIAKAFGASLSEMFRNV